MVFLTYKMSSSPPPLIPILDLSSTIANWSLEPEIYDTPIYEQFFYHLRQVYLDMSSEIESDEHLPTNIKDLLRCNGAKIIMAMVRTGVLEIPIQDMYVLPIDEMITAVENQNRKHTYEVMIGRIQFAVNDLIEWISAQSLIPEVISERYLMIMQWYQLLI